MKKKWLLIIGVFALLVSIKFISAAEPSYYVQAFINWINSNYGPFFGALLGHDTLDEFLFAKVLVLFLIFSVVFMVLGRVALFRENRWIIFILSLIVSVLSVRYIKENELIDGILLPYGAFGGAVTIFLPLLIYFMFVHTSIPGGFGRRAAWAAYAIFFIILWGMREGDIGPVNWIYTLGVIFVLLNFIFDRGIHYYFDLPLIYRANRGMIRRQQMMLLEDLRRANELYAQSGDPRWRTEADDLRRRLRRLGWHGAL